MRNTFLRITAVLIMVLSILAVPFGIKTSAEAAEEQPTEGAEVMNPSESAVIESQTATENVDSSVPAESTDNIGESETVPEYTTDMDYQASESQEQESESGTMTAVELENLVNDLQHDNKMLHIYLYVCLGISGLAIILAIVATIVGARDPSREDVETMDENLHELHKSFCELHDKVGMSFQAIDQRLDEIERKV